jgi:hypothetical protein
MMLSVQASGQNTTRATSSSTIASICKFENSTEDVESQSYDFWNGLISTDQTVVQFVLKSFRVPH